MLSGFELYPRWVPLMNVPYKRKGSCHPSTEDISATPDKSNFVSIVVTVRSRECRRFQVTEWCVFCAAEIISHLYEVFWWRRDIGKSRFLLLFVIYICIKIFSLTFSPVTSSWLDGRRKATVFPRIYILSPVWSEQLIRRVVCRPA